MTLPRTPSRMVRGHLSPRFLPLRRLELKTYRMGRGVIRPRDNVFPGPTVALDGPGPTFFVQFLPRDATQERGIATLSRPSVRPSATSVSQVDCSCR